MELDARFLHRRLNSLAGPLDALGGVWIAYSGGLDSSLLLALSAELADQMPRGRLRAVHIDHGLAAEAADWRRHCEQRCRELGIPLTVRELEPGPPRGESLEAWARQARYDAFAGLLEAGGVMLTGQHADDQLETFLLQALRGAGPSGLAAMPEVSPLGSGKLVRPLLQCPRSEIEAAARARRLDWVEDPSNRDMDRDRSYLRRTVVPALRERWPSATKTVSRSAALCGEAAALLDGLADEVLADRMDAEGRLDCTALREMSPERARAVVRRWLARLDRALPSRRKLERIVEDARHGRRDASFRVAWRGGEVRRYRERLYALAALPPAPSSRLVWPVAEPLLLPGGLGRLRLARGVGEGLSADRLPARVEIGFRRGGERLSRRGVRRAVKSLFQEAGVVPWMRDRIPMLYVDGELAAVADLWVDDRFRAPPGEPAALPVWERAPAVY